MRDALTAFGIPFCDNHDAPSLSTRSTTQLKSLLTTHSGALRGAKTALKGAAPTSPASDLPSLSDLFGDAQSVAAFIELDRRRADATELVSQLRFLREETAIRNSQKIADRISDLLELYQEDYDDKSLSSSSLATFIEFLNLHRESKFPTITATPAGELYVQWKSDECQRLSIQFLAGSEVKWIIFKKNTAHEERTDYLSGQTTVDTFGSTATALGIDEWIVE
ncbi:hypothetical protein SAMN05216603_103213 [Pseudomonas benzenivorans]|nr:hypothetical protein [Pseudomonas benzenivorans]SDG72995.1 hypothetical protein SAMN05216603_103213 [Pseudomonas benzenivorans]